MPNSTPLSYRKIALSSLLLMIAVPCFQYRASATPITFNAPLSGVTVNGALSQGDLLLQLNGSFLLPTIDPNLYTVQSVSATFSGAAGGAIWLSDPTQIIYSTEIHGYFGLHPHYEGAQTLATDDRSASEVFSFAAAYTLSNFAVPADLLPSTTSVLKGSVPDEPDDLLEDFMVDAETDGGRCTCADAQSLLAFVQYPALTVTYDITPIDPNTPLPSLGSISSGNPSTYIQLAPDNAIVPASVVSQLPSYLDLNAPEPASWFLWICGTIMLGTISRLRKFAINRH